MRQKKVVQKNVIDESDSDDESDKQSLLEQEVEPEIKNIPYQAILLIIFGLFVVVCGFVVWNATHTHKKAAAKTPTAGGSLLGLSAQVIIDDKPLEDIFNVLTTLESNCRPTVGADVYNRLQIGTRAATTSAWIEARGVVSGTCDFYGLIAMENRSHSMEGPVEICHAYFTIALQVIHIRYGDALPIDLYPIAIEVVNTAYPLSLFWKSSPYTKYDIAGVAVAQIQAFAQSADKRPYIYATRFCNQYFATDQLDYYTSIFQPMLAFPFEGVFQRQSNNLVPVALDSLLTSDNLDVLIKSVYAIGDGFSTNPGAQLLVNSFIEGLPVTQLSGTSVADSLHAIRDSITIGGGLGGTSSAGASSLNASAIPVLVIARYTDDIGTYNGFKVDETSIIFMFTDDDPNNVLTTKNITSLPTQVQAFASSSRVMGVFDFTTDHPYEAAFGDAYAEEKDVSDIINTILGTMINTAWQKSGSLLDTFAIKNTIVNGIDIGGRMHRQELLDELANNGLSLGLKPNSFKTDLEENIDETFDTNSTTVGAAAYVLPTNVDWSKRMPQCMPPVVNQKSCNNCWAIAASDSISTQLCIRDGVPISSGISHQHVTGCSNTVNSNGCEPQNPNTAFAFLYGDGHSRNCMPLINTGTKDTGCPNTCSSGSASLLSVVNGIQSGTYTKLSGASVIKKYLDTVGPVSVAITIMSDFKTYFPLTSFSDVIYNPFGYVTPSLGGHMVLLYGYEDNAPTPYWMLQNSWGEAWGNNGRFRVAQGLKQFINTTYWIETNAYAATARVGSISPKTTVELIPGNTSSAVETKPVVYTNKYGCPKMIQNTNQESASAALDGCPSNNARKTSSSKLAHEKGVVSKNSGSKREIIINGWFLLIIMVFYVFL